MTEPQQSGASTDAAAPTADSTEPAALPAPEAPARRPLPLALVALVLAVVALLAGLLAWRGLDARLDGFAVAQVTFDERLLETQRAGEARVGGLAAETERLAAEIARQESELARQQELAERLHAAVEEVAGQDLDRWVVAEVEYLLRIAAHRLALAADVRAASVALETADARLNDLADPAWLGVRAEIADELAALRAVPAVDVEGLALALRSLAKRVETLPVLGARYRPGDPRGAAPAGAAETPLTGEGWQDALESAWAQIKGLVEVRRNDRPVEPMLAPALEYFLYQNLRLQLDAARLALLRGEAPLYQESLRSARDWAATYFDQEHASTRATVAELDRLLAVEIAPPLPDVGAALRALRADPAYTKARVGNAS